MRIDWLFVAFFLNGGPAVRIRFAPAALTSWELALLLRRWQQAKTG
jgi:hypothetical protein